MNHVEITRRACLRRSLGHHACNALRASAQSYPNGQVRLIVPTSPGGVTDTMARIVAQRLPKTLKETVIVDNRPGGNGSVGAIAVAHAPPDGLTLLVTSDATITANPSLSSKLGYQRQGVHADHRAVPRHAGAGGQCAGAGQERARS